MVKSLVKHEVIASTHDGLNKLIIIYKIIARNKENIF